MSSSEDFASDLPDLKAFNRSRRPGDARSHKRDPCTHSSWEPLGGAFVVKVGDSDDDDLPRGVILSANRRRRWEIVDKLLAERPAGVVVRPTRDRRAYYTLRRDMPSKYGRPKSRPEGTTHLVCQAPERRDFHPAEVRRQGCPCCHHFDLNSFGNKRRRRVAEALRAQVLGLS
eukprot:TRINITY_DN6075_c0_g1_i1.p1 TRINITY_DN6075_c0_g1~~TRINITY_DN6075_c0_g1_i1.p1  ORF type:complete len:173 (-),score=17.25 TRINITY_DN6075_c0_g1_i1:52-570(-)